MIGSEFDLEFFSLNQAAIESGTGAVVIVAPPATVAIVDDDPGVRDSLRMLLSASGLQTREFPSAEAFLREQGQAARALRLVKGSHIVVNKRFEHDHAYIFQNPDKRIIFAIPYEGEYTLIGTTDVPVPTAPTDPEAERYRFFEAVTTLITGIAATRPTVLVLDDLGDWRGLGTAVHLLELGQTRGPYAFLPFRIQGVVEKSVAEKLEGGEVGGARVGSA